MTNVTHIGTAPGRRARAAGAEPLPRPLEQVRECTRERALALLAGMLDGADDMLFNMAETETDRERDRYFDAMRELRLQRRALETGFHDGIVALFNEIGRERKPSPEASSAGIESLTLVQNDELEISVALDNLARRARNGCEEALALLCHRLEYLFEGKVAISEKNNPLEPRQLAACFADCVLRLSLDIRARLIVLKLFERVVMDEAPALVEQANRTLAQAGVLSELASAPVARRPARRSGGTESRQAGDSQTSGADLGQLGELLALLRGPAKAVPEATPEPFDLSGLATLLDGVAHRDGAPITLDQPVQAVSRDDLMQVLSRLQRDGQGQPGREERQGLRESLARELDQQRDQQQGAPVVHALEQADDDLINLVAMLFDFILDDESLPADVKALIGRLQIPLLKVAINDNGFFGDDGHPARALLNTLARAGAQWDPQQGTGDELYQRIRRAVYTVIDHYDEDDGLFAQLQTEFDEYFSEQDTRARRLAQRLRESEEGRARAEQAMTRARAHLDQRLAGRALPEALIRLLRQGWQQVLYLTLLREGEDSEAWRRQSKIADALIWCLLPHATEADQHKARQMAPKLRVAVAQGLAAIQHDEVESQALVRGLALAQEAMLRGQEPRRVKVKTAPEDVTASPLPEDDALLARARALRPGQWVEIGMGDEARRARLAANIREGAKLVFINRRGIKVEEFDATALAVAMREGTVKLIDEGALFDRALEAVIGDLRRRQGH
ncbi:hypothetical protein MA04_01140 [Alcanivorax balearicus MACL04]|uniref:Thymidine phosphorylase n=1 Tax=Alloalcanivorax balearicus MACL04 TaxID=1177182 RepID=A0ABT2QWD7_9GAMM|nr:DUF1631 domain-containing protein [Alloalcanivorax balearicus]MCU5781840.1 hypothetical protein [Alloalcanivorax balearicus MACL04]